MIFERKTGKSNPILRIDDRLIHGQVAYGWGMRMNLRKIIMASDKAAADRQLKELYQSLIPPEIEGKVLSLQETLDFVRERTDLQKIMIVVELPDDAVKLIEGGLKTNKIIIGGLHHREGCKAVLPYVYLNEDFAKSLQMLREQGLKIVCQDLPTSSEKELTDKHLDQFNNS